MAKAWATAFGRGGYLRAAETKLAVQPEDGDEEACAARVAAAKRSAAAQA